MEENIRELQAANQQLAEDLKVCHVKYTNTMQAQNKKIAELQQSVLDLSSCVRTLQSNLSASVKLTLESPPADEVKTKNEDNAVYKESFDGLKDDVKKEVQGKELEVLFKVAEEAFVKHHKDNKNETFMDAFNDVNEQFAKYKERLSYKDWDHLRVNALRDILDHVPFLDFSGTVEAVLDMCNDCDGDDYYIQLLEIMPCADGVKLPINTVERVLDEILSKGKFEALKVLGRKQLLYPFANEAALELHLQHYDPKDRDLVRSWFAANDLLTFREPTLNAAMKIMSELEKNAKHLQSNSLLHQVVFEIQHWVSEKDYDKAEMQVAKEFDRKYGEFFFEKGPAFSESERASYSITLSRFHSREHRLRFPRYRYSFN